MNNSADCDLPFSLTIIESPKIKSGIYVIISNIDGKRYIGATNHLAKRRWAHFNDLRKNKHANQHLQYAFNKFGEENFSFEIICKTEEKYLDEKEIYYIAWFNTLDCRFGYNLMKGGKHPSLTQEHKDKLSIAHLGKKHSEETKRKISKNNAYHNYSEEKKKEISEKISKNHSHYWKGKTRSKKTRAKMSKNNAKYWKGKTITKEAKIKYKETMQQKSPEELKARNDKISATVKRLWDNGHYDNKRKQKKNKNL
jgi:group I intron endonuclease